MDGKRKLKSFRLLWRLNTAIGVLLAMQAAVIGARWWAWSASCWLVAWGSFMLWSVGRKLG